MKKIKWGRILLTLCRCHSPPLNIRRVQSAMHAKRDILNTKVYKKIFLVVTESNLCIQNNISSYHFIFKEGSTPAERRYDEGIQTALFHQTLLASEQHAISFLFLFNKW